MTAGFPAAIQMATGAIPWPFKKARPQGLYAPIAASIIYLCCAEKHEGIQPIKQSTDGCAIHEMN